MNENSAVEKFKNNVYHINSLRVWQKKLLKSDAIFSSSTDNFL